MRPNLTVTSAYAPSCGKSETKMQTNIVSGIGTNLYRLRDGGLDFNSQIFSWLRRVGRNFDRLDMDRVRFKS